MISVIIPPDIGHDSTYTFLAHISKFPFLSLVLKQTTLHNFEMAEAVWNGTLRQTGGRIFPLYCCSTLVFLCSGLLSEAKTFYHPLVRLQEQDC